MRNARKPIAALVAVLGVLAFSSAPAWAGQGYESVTSTFGGPCPASPTPCPGGDFNKPTSIAVSDETEDVYVLDSGNDRIEYFTTTGTYLGQFNGSGEYEQTVGNVLKKEKGTPAPAGTFLKPGGIAVDNTPASPSFGDVYVADTGLGHEVVDKFSATGEYLGQLTGTCTEAEKVPPACEEGGTFVPFVSLFNVAVDAAGDVWVYEGNGPADQDAGSHAEVDELSDAGSSMGVNVLEIVAQSDFPNFAVDSSGDIFAVGGGGRLYGFLRAENYDEHNIFTEDASKEATLAIISANNDLLVDEGSSIELFNSPIGAGAQPILTFPATGLSESVGIAVNGAKGDGTIYATQRGSDDVDVLDSEPAKAPFVVPGSESASSVGKQEAKFAAVIDPENRETTYSFQLSYSKKTVEEGNGEVAGGGAIPAGFGDETGTSPVVEELDEKLLKAEKTVYFRVVAENEESNGTPTYGPVEGYTKIPLLAGEGVSGLTSTSATLEATINPVFEKTTYAFEYSTEAALLGTPSATTVPGAAGLPEVNEPLPVSAEISGLTPGQTYYWRVAAQNFVTKEVNNANKGSPAVGEVIKEFTPYAAPAIVTGGVQDVTGTAATLSGEVDPEGTEATYHFAYITQAGFREAIKHGAANPEEGEAAYQAELAKGAASPYAEGETTATFSLAASASPQAVGPIPAQDLLPGVTYHYALVAVNKYAIQTIGGDHTFTTGSATPPAVSTGGATNVSQNSATLSGTVTTNGLQTSYGFELATEPGNYGPATGLGSIGGAATETVSVALTRLQPGTTYYYRVTATNADGTEKGRPESFTTPGFPTLIAVPTGRAPLAPLNIVFPKEGPVTTGPAAKPLTRAQKLSKALARCRKDGGKARRTGCEAAARRKYGSSKRRKQRKR